MTDKGKSILAALRNSATIAAALFLLLLMGSGDPSAALWTASMAFLVLLLAARISIDLSHNRMRRALGEISEETLWHESTICMSDRMGILSQGVLALTESRLVYVPTRGASGRLELLLGEIRRVEFGQIRQRVSCAKITRADGSALVFSMTREVYERFSEQVRRLRPASM